MDTNLQRLINLGCTVEQLPDFKYRVTLPAGRNVCGFHVLTVLEVLLEDQAEDILRHFGRCSDRCSRKGNYCAEEVEEAA